MECGEHSGIILGTADRPFNSISSPEIMEREGEDDDIETLASTSDDSCDTLSYGDHEPVVILCEIVGARNLGFHDDNDFDLNSNLLKPYCVAKYGNKIVHRTKCAEEAGCNPIWTVSTSSLFLLKTNPREMSRRILNISICTKRQDGLPVRLMVPESIFLGQVNIDPVVVLSHCDEQRLELKLEDELGESASSYGTISLRFRLATKSDQQYVRKLQLATLSLDGLNKIFKADPPGVSKMALFQKGTDRQLAALVTETPEAEIAQKGFVNALNNAFSSNKIRDKKTGQQKVRIKPYPDRERLEETRYMTAQEISLETRRPSQKWVEAGSGLLGKLYLEILACHGLPNTDVGEAVGNVTDPFICAVYEDTCVMTDVIDDELSPHWLPWTQRAFCFGIMHPASILYLGVFDYDLGLGNHDPIGRVAVNVCNFQRNTVYTLKYDLYQSANVTDRTANGSITLRLRVEIFDEKAALLAAIKPRPRIHVNVCREKSFNVLRYTCFGEYDNEEKFDLTVTRSYINELFEYKSALGYCIRDSLRSLIFWRGQVEVFSFLLPLHSLLFFCLAVTLVERPHMIIPFTLLGISWIMLATLTVRRQHPSPWNRVPSFWHYLHVLATGERPTPVSSIQEWEGWEAAKAYDKAWAKRLEEDRLVAEKKAELEQEIQNIGDDTIYTKVRGEAIPLDLVKRLARYQGYVGTVCKFFRLIKIILIWEESVVSFWITSGFLVAGLLTLLLPWTFILTWTGRIIVWGFFGPHMKLVDLALRANNKSDVTLRKLMEDFQAQSTAARIRREEALKLKDIKSLAFGRYSILVPSYNLGESHLAVKLYH